MVDRYSDTLVLVIAIFLLFSYLLCLKVSIAIPTDESETEDAEFLVVVDDTKLELQDEEAGYKMASKPAKPKSIVFAVPTFDAVEGKKKYIAFVIFTVVSLYSYVDSIIKIIPI